MAKMERRITLQFLFILEGRDALKIQFDLVLNTAGVLILFQDKQHVPKERCRRSLLSKRVLMNVMTKAPDFITLLSRR